MHTADSERLRALRAGPGGWDFGPWLAVVDYLSWWRIRGQYVADSRPIGDRPEPRTYAEVYLAKHGHTIEAQHARRVETYGDPVGIAARRNSHDGASRGREHRANAAAAGAAAAGPANHA